MEKKRKTSHGTSFHCERELNRLRAYMRFLIEHNNSFVEVEGGAWKVRFLSLGAIMNRKIWAIKPKQVFFEKWMWPLHFTSRHDVGCFHWYHALLGNQVHIFRQLWYQFNACESFTHNWNQISFSNKKNFTKFYQLQDLLAKPSAMFITSRKTVTYSIVFCFSSSTVVRKTQT